MYNFDPYNVLLSIATNIPVLLMTAFVLQGHRMRIYKEGSRLRGVGKAVLFCGCFRTPLATQSTELMNDV